MSDGNSCGFRGTNPHRHPWFTRPPKPRDPLPPGCNVVNATGAVFCTCETPADMPSCPIHAPGLS